MALEEQGVAKMFISRRHGEHGDFGGGLDRGLSADCEFFLKPLMNANIHE
jgi:hypothetical protein